MLNLGEGKSRIKGLAELGNKVLIFYFPGMVADAMCWVGCGGYVVGGWGKSRIKLNSAS